MDSKPRRSWLKQTDTQWQTHPQRGYVGQIDYLGLVANPYQLTITGTGAPAATFHPTFKTAKSQFTRFIVTKPVT